MEIYWSVSYSVPTYFISVCTCWCMCVKMTTAVHYLSKLWSRYHNTFPFWSCLFIFLWFIYFTSSSQTSVLIFRSICNRDAWFMTRGKMARSDRTFLLLQRMNIWLLVNATVRPFTCPVVHCFPSTIDLGNFNKRDFLSCRLAWWCKNAHLDKFSGLVCTIGVFGIGTFSVISWKRKNAVVHVQQSRKQVQLAK